MSHLQVQLEVAEFVECLLEVGPQCCLAYQLACGVTHTCLCVACCHPAQQHAWDNGLVGWDQGLQMLLGTFLVKLTGPRCWTWVMVVSVHLPVAEHTEQHMLAMLEFYPGGPDRLLMRLLHTLG
jgi:hypothetical protein